MTPGRARAFPFSSKMRADVFRIDSLPRTHQASPFMSKTKDTKKETKKAPSKTPKEKKAAKAAKKAGK